MLIRYADQTASQSEREQAAHLIQTDAAAAELYETLHKTQVPLQHCVDAPLPAANQNVVDLIKEWQPANTSIRSEKRYFGTGALAAALAVGVVAGHLVSATITRQYSASQIEATVEHTDSTPRWIRLVADYHQLYARQTIARAQPNIDAASVAVSEWLTRETSIPDLSAANISFKRAQQLTVEGDTLVQLAYLPAQDRPVAVCIRKSRESNDTSIKYESYDGMQYATWQDGEHAVVIVGHFDQQELKNIAPQVKAGLFNAA